MLELPDFDDLDPNTNWPDPTPLGVGIPPPWPDEVLPDWMQAMVQGVADELQAPRDLPGMLGIGLLAILHGGLATVGVRSAWSEGLNLYTVTALPPSVGKSPAVKLMFAPVIEWIDAMREMIGPRIEQAKQKRRMIEVELNKAEKAGDASQAGVFLDDLRAVEVPPFPQLWTDDATPEAFVKRMSEHRGRMSILSTEGGVFQLMAGRYSDQMANLDPYLKAWSGDEIVVDRIGRDPITIPKPTASIVLTVQPSVLQQVGENTDNRNRGLPARFMMSVPSSNVGHRNLIDAPELTDVVRWRYADHVKKIIAAIEGLDTGTKIGLSPQARRLFLTWRQSLEVRRGEDLRPLAEWSTKLESSTVRVAALLHLADLRSPLEPVDEPTMRRAVKLGEYWIGHAKIAHEMWDADSSLANARAVLRKATEDGITETTLRDLQRGMRSRFPNAEPLAEALELLVDNGWLKTDDPDGEVRALKRGAHSPRLFFHPKCTGVAGVAVVPKDSFQLPSLSEISDTEARTSGHEGHEGQVPKTAPPAPPVDNPDPATAHYLDAGL